MLKMSAFQLGHAVLTDDEMKLSAQAKYLLIRTLCVFQKMPSKDTIQQLASKIGMPRAALTKAQAELVDKGWARYAMASNYSRKQSGISPSGNFRRGFVLDSGLLQEVNERAGMLRHDVPEGRRAEMLTHLLLWAAPVDTGPVLEGSAVQPTAPKLTLSKGEKMPFQARLVMGVLLCLADRHGIAWDCPMGKLAGLTGLTITQVSYQLRALEHKGLICYRVPGRNGQLFFNRSPGAIVLDLGERVVPRDHRVPPVPVFQSVPEYKFLALALLKVSPSSPLARTNPVDRIGIDAKEFVEQVVRRYARIPESRWNEGCENALIVAIDRVASALVNRPTAGEGRYAIYRVCRYATMALQGMQLTRTSTDPLIDTIRKDLLRKNREAQLSFEFSVAAGLLFLIVNSLVAEIRGAFARGSLPTAVIPGVNDPPVIRVFGDDLGLAIFPSDLG